MKTVEIAHASWELLANYAQYTNEQERQRKPILSFDNWIRSVTIK